jgi:type II secretory pathway pseudopilin PulG
MFMKRHARIEIPRRKGFIRVELVVAIGILVLVAAILIPAVESARDRRGESDAWAICVSSDLRCSVTTALEGIP